MARDEVVVDGVRLGPRTDFAKLFRNQLQGNTVFASKTAMAPEDGVMRVVGATKGSAIEPQVRRAVMSLLEDPDPRVRAGSVMAVETYPRIFDADELLHVLDKRPDLFSGVPAIVSGFSDLRWELLRAVVGTLPTSATTLDRLKAAVVDPVNGHWLLAGLTRSDPGWILDHTREAVAGQASRVQAILTNLDTARHREEFIKALLREPADFRSDVASKLERPIRDPAERERLRKLLTG